MATAAWQDYLAPREQAYMDELIEILRIPSISTDPARKGDVARTADWVAARLTRAGVPTVKILPSTGHPVVYGLWPASDPKAPRVLVYGHYDVQPAEPLELWDSPAFEPTVRDGKLYARGSADMKANLLSTIHAAEALAAVDGAPPVTIIYLFEGEEEIGSPGLPAVIAQHKDLLACDVVVSADGGVNGFDLPSLTVGLKGLAGIQIDVKTGSSDFHSGMYGARVPNANQVLTQLAATFHDAEGHVLVDGFYDRVRELTAQDRTDIAASAAEDRPVTEESGAFTTWGEAGYTDAERGGARPTLDINGMWGGYQGDGIKTVTPCEAHMKVTCRLVPDQKPEEVVELLKKHVAKHAYPGVSVEVTQLKGSAIPYILEREHWASQAAAAAFRTEYGRDPLYVRSGGSVPVTAVFKSVLNAMTVSVGFGEPGCAVHAPNEWYRVAAFARSRRVFAELFQNLAKAAR